MLDASLPDRFAIRLLRQLVRHESEAEVQLAIPERARVPGAVLAEFDVADLRKGAEVHLTLLYVVGAERHVASFAAPVQPNGCRDRG